MGLVGACTRLHIPKGEEGLGVECVLSVPGINSLQGRSFQRWLVHQPVKLGGLGLRSQVETSVAAFIGGVDMSLPHFTRKEGICPQLEDQVGRIEGGNRWGTFLAVNSLTTHEFKQAWSSLQAEAEQSFNYLGMELEGDLGVLVEKAGQDRTDGRERS